jgi:hypothetical protein
MRNGINFFGRRTALLTAVVASCSQQANDEFFLATDPSLADVSGAYFTNARKSSMRRPAQNAEQRQRLWDILTEQTGAQWSI